MSDKNQIPWFEGNKNTLKKASNHHAYIFEGPKGFFVTLNQILKYAMNVSLVIYLMNQTIQITIQ